MVNVNSEIGRLTQLLVNQPYEGIGRITPKRAAEVHFDDIAIYPIIKTEHKVCPTILKLFLVEENVLEVHDLLKEVLDHGDIARREILEMIVQYAELPCGYANKLASLSNHALSKVLITGELESEDIIICDSIPNQIFTRDIAVVVKAHLITTKVAKEARYREDLLTRFIFMEHPLFESLNNNDRIINLNLLDLFPPSELGESVSIEYGDIVMLNKDFLLTGSSERSTQHAFESIKNVLFEKKVIDNIVQVQIPKERSFMHVDALFTQIHHDCKDGCKTIWHEGAGSLVTVHNKSEEKLIYPTPEDFILTEVNSNMKFIYTADVCNPYQEREQWTDACNLLALTPGIAIAYDRNIHTALALEKAGYKLMEAQKFSERAKKVNQLVQLHKKSFLLCLPLSYQEYEVNHTVCPALFFETNYSL